jgi:hypothetical protein
MPARFVFLLSLLLVVSGCDSPRVRAEKKLRQTGNGRLRAEAAVLYKDIFSSDASPFVAIKTDSAPASFRAFEPLSVGAYRDGFSLALQRRGGIETGVYVIPEQMELVPQSRGRARFERIAEGIYWYSFDL